MPDAPPEYEDHTRDVHYVPARCQVAYRRGPGEIPARKIELHHAIKEDVEFLYHTQQVAVIPRGNELALKCVNTAPSEAPPS